MSFRDGIFRKKLKRPRKQGGCKRTSFCVNKKHQFLRYMGGLQAKSACKPWGVIRGGLCQDDEHFQAEELTNRFHSPIEQETSADTF